MRSVLGECWLYWHNAARAVLTPTLFVSGLVGAWIVATDGWLRAIAPSHAYGLAVFAALDVVLAIAVRGMPRPAYAGAFLVSLAQFVAMAGDALTFTPAGTLQGAFRMYLLSDTAFVALLGIQVAVAGISVAAIALPHGDRRVVHFDRFGHLKWLWA
ncbi:hypothetical protein E6H36_12350 [Candidatus Bathyarchaeota archaeon]|nr:MAG: hypothetical protein E6H36_12350 [Candidatus Bathyarchaeota archaeon]